MSKLSGFLVSLLLISFFQSFSQNKDTVSCTITNFRLQTGTFNWRGTNTFSDKTSWDSSPYTEGHLQQKSGSNWLYRMNYRLLYPQGYNANYDPGYPVIVMMHGAGERGNCWVRDASNYTCYFDTPSYNPNNNPAGASASQLSDLLNNDHNLVHGGQPHLTARNLAGTKLPNDPTLNPRAFPGFVLFPQMLNGWGSAGNTQHDVNHAVRIIRLLCKQLNIDENRIYVHGLSNGGAGTLNALLSADWLFAAAAPMSAIRVVSFNQQVDSVATVPVWWFQGGVDSNPTPSETEGTIREFRNAGGNARYTLYPSLGHGTWNTAYNEPDFFSWLLAQNKSNIHVYYGSPYICGTTGSGAKLGLGQGFRAYQWERDGQIIAGATSHIYIATVPGVYRARFSRLSATPTEQQWNRWSDPVTVMEVMPEKPTIEVTGTTHLRGPNPSAAEYNTVRMKSSTANDKYYWYRNGALVNIPQNDLDDSVRNYTITTTNSATFNGTYTLRTSGFDNCQSPPSDPVNIFFNNSAPLMADTERPSAFTGVAVNSNTIRLTWNDNSSIERAYEIWRRKSTETGYTFVTKTAEDAVLYLDTNVGSGTTYHYKIRAINTTHRSNYIPSNSTNTNPTSNLVVTTPGETEPPLPPQNLTATATGIRTIALAWQLSPSVDVMEYRVFNGTQVLDTVSNTSTSLVLGNLTLNTVYNFNVVAVDYSGNLSSPSNNATASTYVTGLFYKHSTGAWTDLDETSMLATWATPEFTGTVSTFSIAPRTQEDYFNFEFSGYLYITTAGTYTFRLNSDDGSRLALNNVVIIDHDGTHGASNKDSGNQSLAAGPQIINVKYFENTGGQSLTVSYRGPDTNNNWVTIPASALRSGSAPAATNPPAAPINLTATGFSMTQNNLAWEYPNGLKIVILGSSTAVGTGATAGNGWVNQLTTWLSANTINSTVVNLAVGGFDTYDVMPNGSSPSPDVTHNITYALTLNPHIIIVNLPTNDVANNIPLATTLANFNTLRARCATAGVKMLITTSQPRTNVSSAQRFVLAQTAVEIRTAFGGDVIDIYDELTDVPNDYRIKAIYNSGDNIHLNDAGHTYIFQVAQQKILQYLPKFEVHRALNIAGPFSLIKSTTALVHSDMPLTPSTPYHYKVRAVSALGNSAFSNIASATPLGDTQAPTQPTGLTVTETTFTNAGLIWTASTDNVLVTGYEVWANGVMIGTTPAPGYLATNLTPFTNYTFYVIAYDASGNKSTPSATINTSTSSAETYYSKAAGDLNITATWGKNADGTGDAPASFASNGQYLVVSNRTSSSLGGAWTVEGSISRVVVPSSVTLTVDNAFSANVDAFGTINLNNASIPNFVTVDPGSTINYNAPAPFVEKRTYGNLGLSGTGNKTFEPGTTTVLGNLTASAGVSLKGAISNGSHILLSGDLTYAGAPSELPADFGVLLELNKNGTQTITAAGTLDIFQLKNSAATQVTLANLGAPFTLRTGAAAGGGFSIANGTTLNAGANNLSVIGAGTLNGGTETGRIAINGGDISITTSSASNSNLYFNATNRTVKNFTLNATGTGDAVIQENMNISDALKLRNGEFNANNHVTLLSTASKTANIQEIEGSGTITGSMTVQRHLEPKGRVYRYISTPVAGVTVADWQAAFPITGNFIGASTGAGLGTNASLFYYDEPTGWINYPTLPSDNNTRPIERGRGYSAFIRNTTGPTLISVTGNPFQKNIPVTLDGGTTSLTGWNLVGNPYASTIAWNNNAEAWIKTTNAISSTVYVRDNPLGQYKYYDYATGLGDLAGGKIAPGQAFWVQAIVASPGQLTITEKAKSPDQQIIYREAAPASHLRVNLTQADKSDPVFIAFTNFGTDGYDEEFDARKLTNAGMFNLSSLVNDSVVVAINNVSDSFCEKTVKLNVQNVTAGSYGLSFEKIESLGGVGAITLHDHFANATVDVRASTSYSFNVTSDPLSYGKNRFTITFGRPLLDLSAGIETAAVCGGSARVVLTNTQAGASYVVLNSAEQTISAAVVSGGGTLVVDLPEQNLAAGNNAIRVRASFSGCSSALLPATATVTYSAKPVVSVAADVVSICPGSQATLTAAGAPESGSYKWYNAQHEAIAGVRDANFQTAPVQELTVYYVAAVSANGCESDAKLIQIIPEPVTVPEIGMEQDTLYTTYFGPLQWLKDGQPIAGATGHQFKPEESGSYTVAIVEGSCTVQAAPIDVVITGTESPVGDLSLRVYPNPTTMHEIHVMLKSNRPGDVEIELVDLVGKPVLSATYTAEQLATGVHLTPPSTMSSGLYLVTAKQGTSISKQKIIVKD